MEGTSSLGQAVGLLVKRVNDWVTIPIRMLPNLVVAIFVLVAVLKLRHVLAKLVKRAVLRVTGHAHTARLMAAMTRLAVITVGIILALDVLNLDRAVASLLAGVGILGIAFGFASQDITANFMAGIILHFVHPFRINDLIRSGEFLGYVEALDMRSTHIRNQQGQRITIPNKNLLGTPIINYTITGVRRVDLTIAVDCAEDLGRVEALSVKAVESLEPPWRNPERPVEFYYEKFDGTNINFSLRFWTQPDQGTYLKAESEAIRAISRIFKENNIGMPSSTITLDFEMTGVHSLREQLQGVTVGFSSPGGKSVVTEKD
jgi:small conductance mechanosensitive channel